MIALAKEPYHVTCKNCKTTFQIFANREDVQSWMKGESYIQDVLHYLSAGERELLMSGTCNSCWKEMFGGYDD
jgi:hypothetical protein